MMIGQDLPKRINKDRITTITQPPTPKKRVLFSLLQNAQTKSHTTTTCYRVYREGDYWGHGAQRLL